jgi:hypothetical protein
MVGENFNGIIDEMTTLITYQSNGQPNLVKMNLYMNFSLDGHCIVAQRFCFHPFGGTIYCY